jgi:hypothetical protein
VLIEQPLPCLPEKFDGVMETVKGISRIKEIHDHGADSIDHVHHMNPFIFISRIICFFLRLVFWFKLLTTSHNVTGAGEMVDRCSLH